MTSLRKTIMKTLRVLLPSRPFFHRMPGYVRLRFTPPFASVQAILEADCGGCHGMRQPDFRRESGFGVACHPATSIQNAGQSAIILKPRM
jgi:hypothetical protein